MNNSNTWLLLTLLLVGGLALVAALKGNLNDVISALFANPNNPVKGTDNKTNKGKVTGTKGSSWVT